MLTGTSSQNEGVPFRLIIINFVVASVVVVCLCHYVVCLFVCVCVCMYVHACNFQMSRSSTMYRCTLFDGVKASLNLTG